MLRDRPADDALPSPGTSAGSRFGHAVEATLHHELAIMASAIAVIALTWGGANPIGAWTFLVLWGMRLGAKLNLFLGVPNTAEEFLPEHLRYIESFFRKRPMNLFFPLAVTASTTVAALLIDKALSANAAPFEAAGFTLIATLMALAVLEHWFLVLPLPAVTLWRWGLRSRDAAPAFRIPLLAAFIAGIRPQASSTPGGDYELRGPLSRPARQPSARGPLPGFRRH